MNILLRILTVIFLSFSFLINAAWCEDSDTFKITKIHYTEKNITELSEIRLYAAKHPQDDKEFSNKVDELIDLLEAQKKAAEQGQDIDRLQETVKEINQLLEEKKAGPPKLTVHAFQSSICFNCHRNGDFTPNDKTQKQWRRLIEEDGHSIFETISWETPIQKQQILEFLLENAGTYRAEGIGLWN